MLLDRLNELASVHLEEVLSRWHLVCRAHPTVVQIRTSTHTLLRFNDSLDFIISLCELPLQLIELLVDSLSNFLLVEVASLGQILMQVLVADCILDATVIHHDTLIWHVLDVQRLEQLLLRLARFRL